MNNGFAGFAGIHKFAVGSGAPMLAVFTATADGLNLPQTVVSFQEVRDLPSGALGGRSLCFCRWPP